MTRYSFEEFKLMFESTEKVTDRRHSHNKTNYSICAAILVAIAFVWKWASEKTDYFFCGLLFILVISFFAFIFCRLWLGQMQDFKNLNTAKFDVLEKMSKDLFFEETPRHTKLISFQPFKKEWEYLKKEGLLKERRGTSALAMGATRIEEFLPKAFMFMFILITIISLLSLVLNPSKSWEGIKFMLHL